jgi:hypothetical protein
MFSIQQFVKPSKRMKTTSMLELVLLIGIVPSFGTTSQDRPSFRADLTQFGFLNGREVGEYSSISFLSADLLLVAINQRQFAAVEPLTTDNPPSTLVLFDVRKKQVVSRASIKVMKSAQSVVLLNDGNFLVSSASDIKLCSPDLRCEKSFATKAAAPLDSDYAKRVTGIDVAFRSNDVSADGAREVSSELSSTTWYRIRHPLDNDEPSPPNFRRISVYDKRLRKTLLSLHYNPKNHLVRAALSPDGTKLAIVREGVLEVYELP